MANQHPEPDDIVSISDVVMRLHQTTKAANPGKSAAEIDAMVKATIDNMMKAHSGDALAKPRQTIGSEKKAADQARKAVKRRLARYR